MNQESKFYLIIAGISCLIAAVGILLSLGFAKAIDHKRGASSDRTIAFSKRHPKISTIIGLFLLIIILSSGIVALYNIVLIVGSLINTFIHWVTNYASKLDSVIIVALITGAVTIGSSILSKWLDYNRIKREYLSQKREGPYGDFINMIYSLQMNNKVPGSYTEEMMTEDILRFSKQLSLWGSPEVVKKWDEFREKGSNPNTALENLLIIEEIMNYMRKDLGQKRIRKGDLLSLFVTDIKKVMKENKK